MIDNKTLEDIALVALDLDPGVDADALDRELAAGLHRPYVDEMQDLVAEIALSAPSQKPPASALGGALMQIGSETKGGGRFTRVPQRARWAFAAAAAVALIAGAYLAGRRSADPAELVSQPDTHERGGVAPIGDENPDAENAAAATLTEEERRRQQLQIFNGVAGDRNRNFRELVVDFDRMKEAYAELRKERDGRFVGAEGLSRIFVAEMQSPDASETETSGDAALSRLVGDAVAAALEETTGETSADKAEPAPEEPDGESEPARAEIEGRDESSLPRHVEELKDGVYWDGRENELWIRSDVDGVLVEVEVPHGFDYEDLEDYPEIDAIRPGSLPGPRPAEGAVAPDRSNELLDPLLEPVVETSYEALVDPLDAPLPTAYSIFHETTGEGSIIVANLQPPSDDMVYQLWVRDTLDGRVLPVGALPEDLATIERIEFPPGLLGVSPAGFMLTLERDGEVTEPSENIVLQGPKPPQTTP